MESGTLGTRLGLPLAWQSSGTARRWFLRRRCRRSPIWARRRRHAGTSIPLHNDEISRWERIPGRCGSPQQVRDVAGWAEDASTASSRSSAGQDARSRRQRTPADSPAVAGPGESGAVSHRPPRCLTNSETYDKFPPGKGVKKASAMCTPLPGLARGLMHLRVDRRPHTVGLATVSAPSAWTTSASNRSSARGGVIPGDRRLRGVPGQLRAADADRIPPGRCRGPAGLLMGRHRVSSPDRRHASAGVSDLPRRPLITRPRGRGWVPVDNPVGGRRRDREFVPTPVRDRRRAGGRVAVGLGEPLASRMARASRRTRESRGCRGGASARAIADLDHCTGHASGFRRLACVRSWSIEVRWSPTSIAASRRRSSKTGMRDPEPGRDLGALLHRGPPTGRSSSPVARAVRAWHR